MKKLSLEELGRPDLETYAAAPKLPVTIVLDNIRSALNVGSIFRTADAMAIEQLILCGITAIPPHKEINKTAIGATNSVTWSHERDILSVIETAKSLGHQVIGIEQTDASVPLDTYEFSRQSPLTIVFGNEVNGLSDSILPLLDDAIEIPQYGTKHSLNVSVCAGIIMWAARQGIV